MELKEKTARALTRALHPEQMHLVDDEGITGYVVCEQFRRVPALQRQTMIGAALDSARFTRAERRRIIAIAGLTPAEFSTLDAATPEPVSG